MSTRVRLLKSLPKCAAIALALGTALWALPSRAQSTNITVTVNGVASAPGTYDSAHIFQATCEGTETTTSTSGDPAIFRLQWAVASGDTIFWDTAADCKTGNTVTNDAGAVISGSDVTGSITIDPPGADSASGYGVGAGNVEINMRTVFTSAFPTIYGNIFDGGNPCVPPEQGTLYVCVTQQVNSSSQFAGVTTTTLAWYMAVNYDTSTPQAPSGIAGVSGDSNVTVDWSFSDVNFPPQAISFNVYYQPDPNGLVPDTHGTCSPGTGAGPNESGSSPFEPRLSDAGCPLSDQNDAGDCCGDAGVNANGGCNPSPGINTPGVCNGCFQSNTECGGNNRCVYDGLGNPYCAASCSSSEDLDGGGNSGCPVGFACQAQQDFNGINAFVCTPSPNLCIPFWVVCGHCRFNSDCPSGGGECIDAGAANYCAVPCDAGVNADGSGQCLGATTCEQVTAMDVTNNLCALPSYDCYNPTPLGIRAVPDAGAGDAGGSGIDTTGWQVASFSGTLSTGQIGGLTNGTCYDFVVQTVIDDGTQGDKSGEVVVAPVKNYDFWRLYQIDGGGDGGGLHCQAGGGAVGILGVLAALLGFRRRRPPESRE